MLPFDPKKPLYGVKMRAPHAKRRIHLFTDGKFIYFRPKNAPSDWWGVILGERSYLKLELRGNNGRFCRYEKSVRTYIEQGDFLRVFDVTTPGDEVHTSWRILWRPEIGVVTPLNHAQGLDGACFSPHTPQRNVSLWSTPTSIIRKHFETEWQNPKSDVRLALPWCDLVSPERDWQAIKWERGSRKELEDVVKAMLVCSPLWATRKEISVAYTWSLNETGKSSLSIHLFQGVNSPHQAQCNRLTSRIEEIYRSHYNLPEGRRDDWLLPWRKYGAKNYYGGGDCRGGGRVWYPIDAPSQHERMEASLFLRDWLRGNAPDLLGDWFPEKV